MRALLVVMLLLAALAPSTAAQGDGSNETPDGVDVTGTGVPTAEESIEGPPGFAWGGALLVGVLLFAGALAWASWRYARRPPSAP